MTQGDATELRKALKGLQEFYPTNETIPATIEAIDRMVAKGPQCPPK